MSYYRGFKAKATRQALKLRSELGLGCYDVFNAVAAASHLRISVLSLGDYATSLSEEHLHCLRHDEHFFSAMTVFRGEERRIIYNDAHSSERTRSDIAHELSHALLEHPAHVAFHETGCRLIDRDHEEEATFLASALIVTEEMALWTASSGLDPATVSKRFGASPQMLTFRMNMTGAHRRVARRRRSA